MSDGSTNSRDRSLLTTALPCPDALHHWVEYFTGLNVPRDAVCPNHVAPFEYLRHAYFEPTKDVVVWAPRGGGKTRLAAVATLLDLLHKPPCSVRILGGSLEQSLRMWEHLLPDLERLVEDGQMQQRGTSRRVRLSGGSTAAVLTQSERAVRGLRVQKLRCDEVELFKPHIWEAAQLVTRSISASPRHKSSTSDGDEGKRVISGAVEALSTLHTPFGLMQKVIEQAEAAGVKVVRWCLLEVLEKCPAQRDCGGCALWDDCRGIAKTQCGGFVPIDDAIAMKQRVSREMWEAEMLCRRPSVRGCVFPHFDPAIHVTEREPDVPAELWLAIDFGFANPFVCLWVRAYERGNVVHVIDEYVQPQRTITEHLEQLERRPWGRASRIVCDPAGAGRNDQTASSNVQMLRSAGYTVRHRPSRIVDGVEMIRSHLAPASGSPSLFIHARCARLIRAMRSYRYAEGGSELPLKDGEHDHLIDALRYFFVNHGRSAAQSRAY